MPVFEQAKTVHALDRAATMTGSLHPLLSNYSPQHPVFKQLQSVFFTLWNMEELKKGLNPMALGHSFLLL
jgi:hypothetical protein